MIYYNKTLFEEKGFIDPEEGWTWEQFVEIAQQLKREGYNVAFPLYPPILEPFVKGLGGLYNSKDLTFSGYMDSENTINAFQRLSNTQLFEFDSITSRTYYDLGVTGLFRGNTGDINKPFRNENFAFAPFPDFPESPYELPSHITGLALTKQSKHKELAWELMKFIVGESDQEALDFAAYYSVLFDDHRYYSEPHSRDSLLIERATLFSKSIREKIWLNFNSTC
jgi:ABC-type sugar transport system, periplasmic component